MIKIKRAYETAEKEDGYRILIDRLWPRGIKKSDLVLDEWTKELAPSSGLRKSFGHDPAKWQEFRTRYQIELQAPAAQQKITELAKRSGSSNITLVYSARDEEHNDAIVLKDVVDRESIKIEKRSA